MNFPYLPRVCTKCGLKKNAYKDFYTAKGKNGRHYFLSRCNDCEKQRGENPSSETKEKRRKTVICRNHGITKDHYDQMLHEQNHCCAICHRLVSLDIDHDHQTGEVRGLLCRRCNMVLGSVNDDPELLQAMITYLKGEK